MTNPLIQKWEELYGKKEKPKVIKAENAKIEFEGEVTLAQVENAFKKWSSNTSVASNLTSPSVATSNTGITKASNIFTTHDIHDTNKSFLQVAETIKNGEAQVSSMSMEMDIMSGTKITFEVMVYEP